MMPTREDPRLAKLPEAVRTKTIAALDASATRPSEVGHPLRSAESQLWESAMIEAGFVRHDPASGTWDRRAIPLASELGATQRALAEIYADVPGVYLQTVGVYSAAWVRRRWLGLDPPGVLFSETEIEHDGAKVRWPMFHALRALRRVSGEKAMAHVRALPVAQRVELLCDLALARLDFFESTLDGEIAKARAALTNDAGAWAAAFADRLIALFAVPGLEAERGNARLGPGPEISLTVLLALVRAGVPIEERWESFFTLGSFDLVKEAPEVLRAIPDARREQVLEAALARNEKFPVYRELALTALPSFPYPSVARYVLDGLEWLRKPREAKNAIAEVGARHPAVRAVLDAFERSAPVIPVLRIEGRTKLGPLAALDARERAQLEAANQRYGGAHVSAEALYTDEDAEERIFPALTETARVLDADGVHVYDAWLYMGDSGSIFRAGTTELVAEIIQTGIETTDRVLKQALKQAFADARESAMPEATKKPAAKKQAAAKKKAATKKKR